MCVSFCSSNKELVLVMNGGITSGFNTKEACICAFEEPLGKFQHPLPELSLLLSP